MIRTRQLDPFLRKASEFANKEAREKVEWEFWLHRVHDQSFGEFCEATNAPQETEAPTKSVLAGAIDFTMSMSAFNPEEGE